VSSVLIPLFTIGVVILVGILVRYIWIGVGFVVSESMFPALLVNDIILINKLNKTPIVGDIFAFKYHNKTYIKRVAIVNGNGVYFLGDNKKNSKDSRFFGYISRDQLVGRVFKILLSFDEKCNIRWNRIWSQINGGVWS